MSRNNRSIKWMGLNMTLSYLGKFINNDFGIKSKHVKLYDIENLKSTSIMKTETNNYKFSPIKIKDYSLLSDRNFNKYIDYYKYFNRVNTSNRTSTEKKRFVLGRNNDTIFNIAKYRTLRNFTQEKQSSERNKKKKINFSVKKPHSKAKLKIYTRKHSNEKSNFYYISQNYNNIVSGNKNKIKKLLFHSEITKPKIMK